MRAKLLLTLAAAAIVGCAGPRVHVFTEGLDRDELAKVSEALEDAGYEIAPNSLPVPEAIIGPTVLYSPTGGIKHVETLGNLLLSLGYDVGLEAVSRGNHFYTANNVGLYLGPAQQVRTADKTLEDREFNGDCENLDAYLRFDRGRFTIEFIGWDENADKEVITRQTGLWERDGSTVSLHTEEASVELFLTPVQYETQYGSIKGIKLLNDTDELQGCSFVYREVGNL